MSKKKSPNKAKSNKDEVSKDEVSRDEVPGDNLKGEVPGDKVPKDEVPRDEVSKDDAIIDKKTVVDDVIHLPHEAENDSPTESLIEIPETTQKSVEPVDPVDEKDPATVEESAEIEPPDAKKTKRRIPLLGLFNLLLIIGIIVVAYYYWQMQQQQLEQSDAEKQVLLSKLQSQLDKKADLAQVQAQFTPLKSGIGSSESRINELQKHQKALQDSTKKLFDLFSRGDNDWQLAEVAYLMRVAQHKLALENDFEGAALTLQAASDKIAATADPGFLPVRVLISEEIADLKTRTRPDLVGMTLLLSQLGQQIKSLKPGYQPVSRINLVKTETTETAPAELKLEAAAIADRVKTFFSTLVTVKRNSAEPTTTEALIINIEEILDSNLKLTRWTVLERDDFQYRQLMQENIRLFKQYYDLDNAANNDFYNQLLQLQKSPIKPEKPAIDGSLQLLKKIITQRQNAPDPAKIDQSKIDQLKIDQTVIKAVSEAADNV